MSSLRPRPRIASNPPQGNGKGASKMKRHVSDEGRQKLSEMAKRRHAEGGFKKKNTSAAIERRRKKKLSKSRVAQMVAEAALEKKTADAIIEVFKDGIHPNQPMTIRLKAAEAWLGVEREEGKLTLKEQDSENQKRDREELLGILSEKLTTGHAATLIRKQIESQAEIVDAEVVDDEVTK